MVEGFYSFYNYNTSCNYCQRKNNFILPLDSYKNLYVNRISIYIIY